MTVSFSRGPVTARKATAFAWSTLQRFCASSKERSHLVPDMPTMAESGLPGFDSWTWFGIFGPAGTPPAVVDRVNTEVNRIVSDPAVRERFAQLGFETTGGTPSQFSALVESETAKWSKVIREAHVKPE